MGGKGTTIGVFGVYSAVVRQDDVNAYLAGTNKFITSVATVSRETSVNEFQGWYNDKKLESINSEGNTVVTIAAKDIPIEEIAKMTGYYYNPTTKMLYNQGSQDSAPYMTCSYHKVQADGATFYQLHKGKWSIGTDEAGTKTDGGIDPKQANLVFTSVNTIYEFNVGDAGYKQYDIASDTWITPTTDRKESLKMLVKSVDKADVLTVKDTWYTTVQLPTTDSAPALTITPVPADSATNVAIDIAPTLTFNNSIQTFSTTLLDGVSVVSSTVAIDVASKVITITPASNLSNSTAYTLVYEVKDVYGQISNNTVSFTTVA